MRQPQSFTSSASIAIIAGILLFGASQVFGSTSTEAPDTTSQRPTAPTTTITSPAEVETAVEVPEVVEVVNTAPTTTITSPAEVETAVEVPEVVEVVNAVSEDCLTDNPVSVLNANLGSSRGSYGGGDYQRAFDLGDGRVLWVLQDVFLSSHLVHNAAFVQSGSCFEMLNTGTDNWLYDTDTNNQRRWFWIFDANVIAERNQIELVVAEMVETGSHYLDRVRVAGTSIVTVDTISFKVLSSTPFQNNPDLSSSSDAPNFYGWSIVDNTNDGFRYLWSHCYAQFGFDGLLGFSECTNDMFLARVAGPSITGPLEFWTGAGWSPNQSSAVSTVNFFVTEAGINPGDVAFDPDTRQWHLIVKVDDWWSNRVVFATADHPAGPWTVTSEVTVEPKCSDCNSYYASWVPANGSPTAAWSVGHNHWHTGHTSHYFPAFHDSPHTR